MKLVCISLITCVGIATAAVPVPKIAAPPVPAGSHAFLANDQSLTPVDLAKAGYVEEEFIVTGNANVYDWTPDGAAVQTSNAPYGTRVLIRRPANPAKFSGTVVVEIPNTARFFDWAPMWGYLHDRIMEHGDAWVLPTLPGSANALKKFNATRYAAVSFANPAPDAPCPTAPGRQSAVPREVEEGLKWDVLSQVAAALKSDAAPLHLKARYVYMTAQGNEVVTYINAFHAQAGVYDGYLIKNALPAARLSQCGDALAKGDPRQRVIDVNVPVINVVAQGEVRASLAMRKPNSDDPGGRYREYEVAGAAHIDKNGYLALPIFEDQKTTGGRVRGDAEFPFDAPCEPPIPLSTHPLLKYVFNAALANLDAWVRKGTPPPKAERIALKDEGTPQVSLVTDEYGAGAGGVRSPYVDVPRARYYMVSPGPGNCRELGHVAPFESERMVALYGDGKIYAAKVNASVERGVKERFFTESDGKKMKAGLLGK